MIYLIDMNEANVNFQIFYSDIYIIFKIVITSTRVFFAKYLDVDYEPKFNISGSNDIGVEMTPKVTRKSADRTCATRSEIKVTSIILYPKEV